MKVKFNGVLEKSSGGGCPVCGNRRKSKYGFVTTKLYILPSGQTKTFRVGTVAEVNDLDGNFLLSYCYDDVNGQKRAVFEKVE